VIRTEKYKYFWSGPVIRKPYIEKLPSAQTTLWGGMAKDSPKRGNKRGKGTEVATDQKVFPGSGERGRSKMVM